MNVGDEIKFKCVPVTERYYNSDSSYGVFVFHTKDDIPEYDEVPVSLFDSKNKNKDKKMSILAGNMQQLYLGSEYEVTAVLDYNAKYKSYQYKPKIVTSVVPKSEEHKKMFLSSIVTERQAEVLLAKYPNIVEDIINGKDQVDVRKLNGIGEKTYAAIKQKIIDNYVISDILVLLQPLGVTYTKIKKLLSNESNPALLKEKLLNNPYIMLSIKGFGFKTVDQLALKLDPNLQHSAKRVYAFINYFLKDIGNTQGHTWLYCSTLESAIRDNLNECMDIYQIIVENEKKSEMNFHFSENRIGLKEYYNEESNIYNALQKLQLCRPLEINDDDIRIGIEQSEKDQGFSLTDEQKDLVKNCSNGNVSIIVGKAGTGKTCVSRAILNVYKHAGYSIACCALSAMAAQRITEATGFEASTIHRLLCYNRDGFEYNTQNRLPCDVLFVDECSMINSYLFEALVSAVKTGKKIIMCGDNRQLPPIGYGNIFGDLLDKNNKFSIFKLTKVLRQAEKSGILMDANKIRDGIFPIKQPELKIINGQLQDMTYMFRDTRDTLTSIAIKTYMKVAENDGVDNVVIITPRREKCENSANEINKKIVDLIADKTQKCMKYGDKVFYVGSKVMQTDNNYDKNVFNGEIGYITDIFTSEENNKNISFEVEFKMNGKTKKVQYEKSELEQLDLAYAMTVHKVQGQSIQSVIIITDMTHYTLLDTCLLYTAITRAKKRCLLLSEPMAFKICMDNNKSKSRQTWLNLM